jgi:calcineurin-like phosphoesterase family protein
MKPKNIAAEEADKVWITSDWHYAHANILKYCNRPFKDVEEMNDTLLKNYNSVVSDDDIVFFLGDIAFGESNVKSVLSRMKGTIHYVVGNHDLKYLDIIKTRAETINDLIDVEISGQPITMCHYAMRVWHKSHFDSWMLYGHSHARLPPVGKQWDVGIDYNGFKPLSFEDINHIMRTAPHNDNYISEDQRR